MRIGTWRWSEPGLTVGVILLTVFIPAVTPIGVCLGQSSGKRPTQVIRVAITTRGFEVAQSRVSAGPVDFLIENRTLLREPQVAISPVTGANGKGAALFNVRAKPGGGRKTLERQVLVPGDYWIHLEHAPTVQVKITVVP